jgi:hypothetical protein
MGDRLIDRWIVNPIIGRVDPSIGSETPSPASSGTRLNGGLSRPHIAAAQPENQASRRRNQPAVRSISRVVKDIVVSAPVNQPALATGRERATLWDFRF